MPTYKIRDTKTGLFQVGGSFSWFTSVGKTWSNLGSLKTHLSLLRVYETSSDKGPLSDTWEVVEYDEVRTFPVSEIVSNEVIKTSGSNKGKSK
jgi:hypothetical protein